MEIPTHADTQGHIVFIDTTHSAEDVRPVLGSGGTRTDSSRKNKHRVYKQGDLEYSFSNHL